ncbi:beige/beach-related [Anaeramoeba ignava]|uniref:Beige/beach-related n=1 Tax=Anaeramoeba ignava TaxID=1746090 RepID=A0A9Q0R604_ANAIG|nr:beige/beach-related [Anaeramoeba ignava]
MKKYFPFFLVIVLVLFYSDCCSKDKDCSKDNPRCINGKCVECNTTNDCTIAAYCDTNKHECRTYSSDNVLGEFCQSNNCSDGTAACAYCHAYEGRYWVGQCINFKCEACNYKTQEGLNQDHTDGYCYPKLVSGTAGIVGKRQFTGFTPRFLKQDSSAIAYFVYGFVLLIYIIFQCFFIVKKNKTKIIDFHTYFQDIFSKKILHQKTYFEKNIQNGKKLDELWEKKEEITDEEAHRNWFCSFAECFIDTHQKWSPSPKIFSEFDPNKKKMGDLLEELIQKNLAHSKELIIETLKNLYRTANFFISGNYQNLSQEAISLEMTTLLLRSPFNRFTLFQNGLLILTYEISLKIISLLNEIEKIDEKKQIENIDLFLLQFFMVNVLEILYKFIHQSNDSNLKQYILSAIELNYPEVLLEILSSTEKIRKKYVFNQIYLNIQTRLINLITVLIGEFSVNANFSENIIGISMNILFNEKSPELNINEVFMQKYKREMIKNWNKKEVDEFKRSLYYFFGFSGLTENNEEANINKIFRENEILEFQELKHIEIQIQFLVISLLMNLISSYPEFEKTVCKEEKIFCLVDFILGILYSFKPKWIENNFEIVDKENNNTQKNNGNKNNEFIIENAQDPTHTYSFREIQFNSNIKDNYEKKEIKLEEMKIKSIFFQQNDSSFPKPKPKINEIPNYLLAQLYQDFKELAKISNENQHKLKIPIEQRKKNFLEVSNASLNEIIYFSCIKIFDPNFHETKFNTKAREYSRRVNPELHIYTLDFLVNTLDLESINKLGLLGFWKFFAKDFYQEAFLGKESQKRFQMKQGFFFDCVRFFATQKGYSNENEVGVLIEMMEHEIQQEKMERVSQICEVILEIIKHNYDQTLRSLSKISAEKTILNGIRSIMKLVHENTENEDKIVEFQNEQKILFELLDFYLSNTENKIATLTNEKVISALLWLLDFANTKKFAMFQLSSLMRVLEKTWTKIPTRLFKMYFEKILIIQQQNSKKGEEAEKKISQIAEMLESAGNVVIWNKKILQEYFRDGGIFELLAALLGNPLWGAYLVEKCLEMMISMFSESQENIQFFKKQVGFHILGDVLADIESKKPTQNTYCLLMDMLVNQGKFDPKNNFLIQNPDVIVMIFHIFARNEDPNFFILIETFSLITEKSIHNSSCCCSAGLISFLINLIPTITRAEVASSIGKLLLILCSHSVTVKELKLFFRILNPLSIGEQSVRPHYYGLIVSVMKRMSESRSNFPTNFFNFNGHTGHIILPVISSFPPTHEREMSFLTWLRVESFLTPLNKPKYQPRVFSFSSKSGYGVDFFLTQTTSFSSDESAWFGIQTRCPNITHEEIFANSLVTSKRHYFVSLNIIQHRKNNVEFRLHLDDHFVSKIILNMPLITEELIENRIGSNYHSDKNNENLYEDNLFFGQMGAIYFLKENLSQTQNEKIFRLGPNYLGLFDPAEFPRSSNTNFSSLSSLNQKILFNYNCKGYHLHECFDQSPRNFSDSENKAKLVGMFPSTFLKIHDIINCIGGVRVFFPLIAQLNLELAKPNSVFNMENQDFSEKSYGNLLLSQIFSIISTLLLSSSYNQQDILNSEGIGALSLLFQRVSSRYFTTDIIKQMELLFDGIENISFLRDFVSNIVMNFEIWIYTPFATQRALAIFIQEKIVTDPRQSVYSVTWIRFGDLIDLLYEYYWVSPFGKFCRGIEEKTNLATQKVIGKRPENKQEILELRGLILQAIMSLIHANTYFKQDLISFCYHMIDSQEDTECLIQTLKFLWRTMLSSLEQSSNFFHDIISVGIYQTASVLLGSQHPNIQRLCLEVIFVIELFAKTQKKKAVNIVKGKSIFDFAHNNLIKSPPTTKIFNLLFSILFLKRSKFYIEHAIQAPLRFERFFVTKTIMVLASKMGDSSPEKLSVFDTLSIALHQDENKDIFLADNDWRNLLFINMNLENFSENEQVISLFKIVMEQESVWSRSDISGQGNLCEIIQSIESCLQRRSPKINSSFQVGGQQDNKVLYQINETIITILRDLHYHLFKIRKHGWKSLYQTTSYLLSSKTISPKSKKSILNRVFADLLFKIDEQSKQTKYRFFDTQFPKKTEPSSNASKIIRIITLVHDFIQFSDHLLKEPFHDHKIISRTIKGKVAMIKELNRSVSLPDIKSQDEENKPLRRMSHLSHQNTVDEKYLHNSSFSTVLLKIAILFLANNQFFSKERANDNIKEQFFAKIVSELLSFGIQKTEDFNDFLIYMDYLCQLLYYWKDLKEFQIGTELIFRIISSLFSQDSNNLKQKNQLTIIPQERLKQEKIVQKDIILDLIQYLLIEYNKIICGSFSQQYHDLITNNLSQMKQKNLSDFFLDSDWKIVIQQFFVISRGDKRNKIQSEKNEKEQKKVDIVKWFLELKKQQESLIHTKHENEEMRTTKWNHRWRFIVRELHNERSIWGTRDPDKKQNWKLDKTETKSRKRMRLKINYKFDNHLDASIRRDHKNYTEAQRLLSETDLTKNIYTSKKEEQQLSIIKLTVDANIDPKNKESKNLQDEENKDEEILHEFKCEMIMPLRLISGLFRISVNSLGFVSKKDQLKEKNKKKNKKNNNSNNNNNNNSQEIEKIITQNHNEKNKNISENNPDYEYSNDLLRKTKIWNVDTIREIYKRRYHLQQSAIEIFFTDGKNYFFNFDRKHRNIVFSKILRMKPPNLRDEDLYASSKTPMDFIRKSSLTQQWQQGKITNFDYLMQLNTISGRTYNDLSQYPVFPWILQDYTSPELDLDSPETYRDLSFPVGALIESRRKFLKQKYNSFIGTDNEIPPFHYGCHYSNAGIVLYYLIRMEPFTTMYLQFQDGKFDHPDRIFSSIPTTFYNSIHDQLDVKELIPEFFYLPEFLENTNAFDLGKTQNGNIISNCELPKWAKTPEKFIRIHRKALESDYVSNNLHNWIDLIFGYKQKGAPAVESFNVFYHLTYEGVVDMDAIEEEQQRKALEAQIENFGQTPTQLFTSPHPRRTATYNPYSSFFRMPVGHDNPGELHGHLIDPLTNFDSQMIILQMQ